MRLGVIGLAKTLARTLAADNIRVNVVAPGYFATGRVRRRLAERMEVGMTANQAMREIAGDIPMQHVGEPEELADQRSGLRARRRAALDADHRCQDSGIYPCAPFLNPMAAALSAVKRPRGGGNQRS